MAPKRRPKTRASSRSSAPTVDPDELDDELEEAEEAAAIDESLALFFRRPPSAADHVRVIAATSGGEQIVQDRSVNEVRADPVQFANDVAHQCDRFARAEQREVRFRAIWMRDDRVLASHGWRAGKGDPLKLDGTIESLMMQLQRSSETKDRIYHEGLSMLQSGWGTLLGLLQKRVNELEKQLDAAHERLRKVGDADAEIAVQNAAAMLQQRERMADIVEGRVLPIVQQLAVQHLMKSAPLPAAAPNQGQPNTQQQPSEVGNGS